MSRFAYAIALTGSIATGKSTVSRLFASWGFEVIDLDEISHLVLESQREKISALFGAVYIKEGHVDRKALGKTVFVDTQKRNMLESLLHPLIHEEVMRIAQELDKKERPYLVDIPLFFERNSYAIFRSIVVYTPPEIQLQRLIKREGYTTGEALQRINTQIDIEEKKKRATYVIDNSGDLEQLEKECLRVRDVVLEENWL